MAPRPPRRPRLKVLRTLRVTGTRGTDYEVQVLENGKVRCECTGFRYRGECRHVQDPAVQDQARTLAPRRRAFEEVAALASWMAAALAPYCRYIEVVGSLRRRRADAKDIDLLFVPGAWSAEQVVALFRTFGTPVHHGDTLGSIVLPQGVPVQLFCCPDPALLGAALLHFTGPKDYNIMLRIRANHRGWKFSQHGLVDRQTERVLAAATEEEVLQALELPWLPPPVREHYRKVKALDVGKKKKKKETRS